MQQQLNSDDATVILENANF